MNTKKTIALSIFIIMVLAIVPILASANLEVQETYSSSAPTFGNNNQEASNQKHDDANDRDKFATTSITLFNNATGDDLTNFQISFTSNGNYNILTTDVTIDTNGNPGTITDGLTGEIIIKAKVPEDLDSVDSNFMEAAFDIGTLTVTSNEAITTTNMHTSQFIVYMQRENKLEINDADAKINGKDKQNIDSGDEIDNLKPGDNIELTIEAENLYDDDTNLDIEDVEIEIECDEEDDLDFDDQTQDMGDISPEDEETESIKFDLENDANDGSTTCTIKLSGDDENGALHGQSFDFDLDVVRKNHDIIIKNVALIPSTLTCSDSSIKLTVDATNLGRSDEDNVAVEVLSNTLNILERISNIDLNEDDSMVETFSLTVSPENLPAGAYALQVQTFYDNVDLSDTEVVTIENTCTKFSGSEEEQEEQEVEEFVTPLSLKESTITSDAGKTTSLEVVVSNNGLTAVDYTVSLENLEEVAEAGSSKNVHLNPGQSSTVFLNVKTNDDVEEGKYTATVKVKDANTGETLQTETFTVDIATGSNGVGIGLSTDASKSLMILVNIILVIVAIFFIKLIFSNGKRKEKNKMKPLEKVKLSDFEPAPSKKTSSKKRK